MDLLLVRPTNTGDNHLITNLKPRISANTTFTTERLKFAPEDCFLPKFVWFTPNDLTNKQRILLLVKDFANHAKFVFSWPAWAVYGFENDQTAWQGTYLLSRATYIVKCCWRAAKMINFILNFFPCLPNENKERKLGEWARDTSLDLLSICVSRSFVLMRFEFYLGWQKFWYTGHVHTVCICFQAAGFHPCHMAISHCC